MEQLKVIPVFMFLIGITLIYSGFKDVTPLDVIRGNIGGLQSPDEPDPFAPDTNPLYAGIPVYQRPSNTGPGLYS